MMLQKSIIIIIVTYNGKFVGIRQLLLWVHPGCTRTEPKRRLNRYGLNK